MGVGVGAGAGTSNGGSSILDKFFFAGFSGIYLLNGAKVNVEHKSSEWGNNA